MQYALPIILVLAALVIVAPQQFTQALLAAVWLGMAGAVLWSLGSWLFQL